VRRRFASALDRTLAPPRRPPTRTVEKAAAALGLVAAGWLAGSHLMWSATHADLRGLAAAVIRESDAP
jgi:hypothetical protein